MTAVWMLLLLFLGPVVIAAPGVLPAREVLQYTVEWRLVTAGKARLVWSPTPHHSNPGWQADLHLESTGIVSKLFKVEDEYSANMNSGFMITAKPPHVPSMNANSGDGAELHRAATNAVARISNMP